MGDEILEIEIELGNGSKENMSVKEVDDDEWSDIEKGTRAILTLVNGQSQLVKINSADYDGVSFHLIGDEDGMAYFYDTEVIAHLLVEVQSN